MDEKILIELKLQTALLQEMGTNIAGLRAEMKAVSKEGAEKAMQTVVSQMTSAFKGTPMEGVLSGMFSKGGGVNHG
jgi:hypothetical protein